jgi:hypothetical protein
MKEVKNLYNEIYEYLKKKKASEDRKSPILMDQKH